MPGNLLKLIQMGDKEISIKKKCYVIGTNPEKLCAWGLPFACVWSILKKKSDFSYKVNREKEQKGDGIGRT